MAGGLLDTFYLMFKSNAKETEKDVIKLGDTVDKTGKKIRKTKEDALDLGKAFTEAVEAGVEALATYATFTAIKNGVLNAQEFNRTLTIQAKLWGQNANEIAAWGAAAKAAGGSEQGVFSWYNDIRQQNAAIGRQALPIGQLLEHIRAQVKGLGPEAAQRIFGLYNLQDTGLQNKLMGSDEDWEKTNKLAKELTDNINAAAPAAQAFGTAWDNLTIVMRKFWTTVGTDILPTITGLVQGLTELIDITSRPDVFKGLKSAILSIMPGGGTLLNLFGQGQGVVDSYNKMKSGGATAPNSAMDYLMQKGFSASQAAGIVANMQAESGGNPGAIGDNGAARGLFQWHPDRQANILAGTDIDVTKASWQQQMDAMIWELKRRPEYASFLGAQSPAEAGSIFSQRFESPAGGLTEALKRGQLAMQIAGNTPFASQGGGNNANVNIGTITVNTQATDGHGVAQSLSVELNRQISGLFAQNNDAVAY